VVLAPIVGLALVFDIKPNLLPVVDSGELLPGRLPRLPEVEQHRLTRLRQEARQRWYQAVQITNILTVSDEIIVFFDERAYVDIPLGTCELMVHRIGAEIHPSTDLQSLFRQAGSPGDVKHRVSVG
jgi:hypothetical protein